MVIDAGIMKYFYYTLFGYGAIMFSLVGRHSLNKTWGLFTRIMRCDATPFTANNFK